MDIMIDILKYKEVSKKILKTMSWLVSNIFRFNKLDFSIVIHYNIVLFIFVI